MIESIFYFFIIVSILILVVGVSLRSPAVVGLAGVFFMLMGLMLMSGENIQRDVPSGITITEIDTEHTTVDMNYMNVSIANDKMINILNYLFFYGSFALYAIAFGLLYFNRKLLAE